MSIDESLCPTPEKCKWYSRLNWEGDPSVPKGTHSWIEYVCKECGAEVLDKPQNFNEEEDRYNDLY